MSKFKFLIFLFVGASIVGCEEYQFSTGDAAQTKTTVNLCPGEYIINGSFEETENILGLTHGRSLLDLYDEVAPKWDVFEYLPGGDLDSVSWYSSSGSGIEVQASGVVMASYDGDHHVELDSHYNELLGDETNSRMTQDLALEQGTYFLSVKYSARTDFANDNKIKVSLGDQTLMVLNSHNPDLGWQTHTKIIQIHSNDIYNLHFEAQDEQNTRGGLLDDISLRKICENNE